MRHEGGSARMAVERQAEGPMIASLPCLPAFTRVSPGQEKGSVKEDNRTQA